MRHKVLTVFFSSFPSGYDGDTPLRLIICDDFAFDRPLRMFLFSLRILLLFESFSECGMEMSPSDCVAVKVPPSCCGSIVVVVVVVGGGGWISAEELCVPAVKY